MIFPVILFPLFISPSSLYNLTWKKRERELYRRKGKIKEGAHFLSPSFAEEDVKGIKK